MVGAKRRIRALGPLRKGFVAALSHIHAGSVAGSGAGSGAGLIIIAL